MKDQIETATKYNYAELLDRTDWRQQLAINLGLALPGILAAGFAGQLWLQLLGVIWAIINLAPVAKWAVMG